MVKRVGILTSGGDCPGLNATIRAIVQSLRLIFNNNIEITGILDGYSGLIQGMYKDMTSYDFADILTLGGTILGTKRTPFKLMRVIEDDKIDKISQMKTNYAKMGLDCLFCLGGNGTHKTANLLANEGLNVIALPKTIDNDIWGTDISFGFHSALGIATEVIDRVYTKEKSHKRIMVVELMGNKAGWLTLYAGIAGGVDAILIPEKPFDLSNVIIDLVQNFKNGKNFYIVAVAEGAYSTKEAKMKKKERAEIRAKIGERTATNIIAKEIENVTGHETRAVVPGHIQRGGPPCAFDRILATQFGSYAAKLAKDEKFGVAVAMVGNKVTHNQLSDVAGKSKLVSMDCEMITVAQDMGICLG